MGSRHEGDVLICEGCGKRWHAVAYLLPWQRRCLACGERLRSAGGQNDNDDGEEHGGGSSLVLL